MSRRLLLTCLILLAVLHIALSIPAFLRPDMVTLIDSRQYLDLAKTLINTGQYHGTLYPGVDLVRSPGYPVFLALSGLVSGGHFETAALLQSILLLSTAWLLYRILKSLGYPKAGIVAAVVYLVNVNAAFWATMLMSEMLSAFFIVLALWLGLRANLEGHSTTRRSVWMVLSGAAVGVSALVRPIMLPLGVVWVVVLVIAGLTNRTERKPLWVSSILFAAGMVVLLLPWQFRNLAVYQQFTLSSVGEGTIQNWMIANTLAKVDGITRNDAVAKIASSGNPWAYSWQVIQQHPSVFVKEQARGILRTALGTEYQTWAQVWGNQTVSTSGGLALILDQQNFSGLLQVFTSQWSNPWFWLGIFALLFDGILYSLSLIGVWKAFHSHRLTLILLVGLALVAAAYLIVVPGAAGETRFRAPADPLLALLAGCAFLPAKALRENAP